MLQIQIIILDSISKDVCSIGEVGNLFFFALDSVKNRSYDVLHQKLERKKFSVKRKEERKIDKNKSNVIGRFNPFPFFMWSCE